MSRIQQARMRLFLGLGMVLFLLFRNADAASKSEYLQSLEFVKRQLERLCTLAADGYPDYTENGKWKFQGPDEWTAGYFPGMLWKIYEQTHETAWLKRARRWTEPIAAFRHDERDLNFGLLFKPTFTEGYRLTGDENYRQMALEAAANQAKRYIPEGKYLPSWGRLGDPKEQGFIIIDSLIDMSLLFWAAQEEHNPFLFDVAHNNSLVILQATVRKDGSSIQVVELDPQTGHKRRDLSKQAYSINSCWSRGQGWGIYAFAEIYQYTRDYRFLKAAQRMADYYLAHAPSDLIPYWDFLAPNIPNDVRDSSAAALVASGLLELARLVTDPSRQESYHEAALKIVDSLTRNYLASGEARNNGRILMHGTLHKPAGIGVDESLIFGDYYYLEALLKLLRESIP
jgi:unsaturated chondroitin disaccharide hydrolase